MAFDDLVGNRRVIGILRRSLERRRLPNSLLFVGPPGVGKRACALVAAKALNCLNRRDDSCDVCASCRAIDALDPNGRGRHPDVLLVERLPRKEAIGIDQIREVKETAFLRPLSGRSRVFIVDDAADMTDEAANSLLKVLEEPPLHAHLLLVSHNPSVLLPTIVSRCQTLVFGPIAREEVEAALRRDGLEEAQARILALLVRGSLERARALDWDEVQARREEAWELFMSLVVRREAAGFLGRFGPGRRAEGREDFESVLELLAAFARDALLLAEGGDRARLLNPDYEDRLRGAEGALGAARSLRLLYAVDAARAAVDRNLNLGLSAAVFAVQASE